LREIATGISIHTPAWGVTRIAGITRSPRPDFNPHTRVGCDTLTGAFEHDIEFQSTHPRGV